MRLDVASLSRPRVGEAANGDAVVVRQEPSCTLLAVVDALGHGEGAEECATLAVAFLRAMPLDRSVGDLVASLHENLRRSRGAAALVCVVREGSVEGCGVGNVEMRTRNCRIPVRLSPGVLGSRQLRLRPFGGSVTPSARLVIFSDGVSPRLSLDEVSTLAPPAACRFLLDRYGRSGDDATVLVADVGPPS